MRRGSVAVILAVVFASSVARADDIDRQGRELIHGEPYKVRVSAALWLSKRPASDGRAVSMLANAVRNDRERTVRQLAAAALGRMVDAETPSAALARAEAALEGAVKFDPDRRVRRVAKDALKALRAITPLTEPELGSGDGLGGLFVHVGPATDPTRALPPGGAVQLESSVRHALERGQLHGKISKSNSELPSGRTLRAARQRGFYLGAAVSEVAIRKKGRAIELRCKLMLRVTAWSGADEGERLMASQSAAVTGSGVVVASERTKADAVVQCVTAVGEEVTFRQVVPFLKRFDGRAAR
jgi:hypothetical protein